jgi:hypothetical protein
MPEPDNSRSFLMRLMPLALAASSLLLTACADAPDPWIASTSHAADATAGAATLLRNHYAFDESCIAVAPPVEIVQQGTLGAASVASASETIEDPDNECDGSVANGTGVYYEAASGVSGIDTIVYREFMEGAEPDRIHTVSVRVR